MQRRSVIQRKRGLRFVKICPERLPGGLVPSGQVRRRGAASPVLAQSPGMSSGDTRALIAQAVERLGTEVPSLTRLKLVIRLELRSRGDAPVWRVEVPGPKITKDMAQDARIDVSVVRSHFNELAADGGSRTGWTPTSTAT